MKRKGSPVAPATLSEGDIIILPNGQKAVVTGRPSDSSCTYRTDKGEDGQIESLTLKAYDRRYGWVDPKTKGFTDNDIWFSKSVVFIDTPECCIFCPFSHSNGHGKSSCMLMYHKSAQTGEWQDMTVYDMPIDKLTKENMEESWHYRDPRCPLVDLTPYQPKERAEAISDFVDGLEHEEVKYIKRSSDE